MSSDLYLKAVLTVIAACLLTILIRDLPLVGEAQAAAGAKATRSCKGRVMAMEQGIGFPGGYNVDIECEK